MTKPAPAWAPLESSFSTSDTIVTLDRHQSTNQCVSLDESERKRAKAKLIFWYPAQKNPAQAGLLKCLGLVRATLFADFAVIGHGFQLCSTMTAIFPCTFLQKLIHLPDNRRFLQPQKRPTIWFFIAVTWKFAQVLSVLSVGFNRPVGWSRSISMVGSVPPTGQHGRYWLSVRLHLRRITVNIDGRFGS